MGVKRAASQYKTLEPMETNHMPNLGSISLARNYFQNYLGISIIKKIYSNITKIGVPNFNNQTDKGARQGACEKEGGMKLLKH